MNAGSEQASDADRRAATKERDASDDGAALPSDHIRHGLLGVAPDLGRCSPLAAMWVMVPVSFGTGVKMTA